MPVIIVLPGIAAVVLAPGLAKPDQAYPAMMRYLPTGLLGLVFSALVAAIIASTASKINSIATIFTLDLYAKFRRVPADASGDQRHLVLVGRVAAAVAIVIAMIAARPLIGQSDQAFQFIQEFSGFFTPGITVIFLLGLFWRRASEAGAIAAAVASVALSYLFRALTPEIPFMNRMLLVFAISGALAVVASLLRPAGAEANRVRTDDVSYATRMGFNIGAVGIALILVALYATWW